MTIGRICIREVDTADAGEYVLTAARRMDTRNVGTLIVLDKDRRIAGILTDRDLALRVVGAGRSPQETRVNDVMTTEVQTVFEEMPIEDVLSLMRSCGVRRLPVVDHVGVLVGLVSLDDILALIAEEFETVGKFLEKTSPRSLAKT